MNKTKTFSAPDLEIFAVNDVEFKDSEDRAKEVGEYVTGSVYFSIATGRNADGVPVTFIKSHTPGDLHYVTCPDPDATPDPDAWGDPRAGFVAHAIT